MATDPEVQPARITVTGGYVIPAGSVTTPEIATDPTMPIDVELALELEPIDTLSIDVPLPQWTGSPRIADV